LDVELTVEER
nr:RecName: Full=14-3-3-like protein 3 [Pseudotsuga menziesii]